MEITPVKQCNLALNVPESKHSPFLFLYDQFCGYLWKKFKSCKINSRHVVVAVEKRKILVFDEAEIQV